MINLTVNGTGASLDADPSTPLLWVLRDHLNLTGTKYGCGIGQCGACTVLMNGVATRSCRTSLSEASNAEVVTIEGLGGDGLHPVQEAWVSERVPQCGYCTSGQIMAAAALLEEKSNPTDEEIQSAMGNLCRCGNYSRVKQAVRKVVIERASE